MKKLITIFMGLLICNFGFAQNNDSKDNEFTLSGQLRPRAEYRDGYSTPHADGAQPAGFITNRARFSMDYKRDNKLELCFSAQDVGVWGQQPQVVKTTTAAAASGGRTMINEAWANLNLGGGFFMKVGRQALAYDDERILGALDWNVAGRYHDAAKLGYENKQNKLHLALAFNQNDENVIGNYYAQGAAAATQPYKTMQMLWYQHIGSKLFNISFLAMNVGLETGDATVTPLVSNVQYMQTLGTNISYQPSDFQFYGTFYYQTGKTTYSTPLKDVSAFMWSLNAAYTFNPAWKINIASDYLSGDDGKGSSFGAFNPLYGTHHKFYGTMDYFDTGAPTALLNQGLWDNQLGLTFKASPKVNLGLVYHNFQTTTDVYDKASGDKLKRALGSEWDFQLGWNIMKDVALTGGYSTMFGNDTMKALKGGDPSKMQSWAWVSLNVNPKIFVSKW